MTPATEERPLVTFALFAYNQENYIHEAVKGAFAQTYSPLEIILSDDGSRDRTFEIMQEMVSSYTGPHTVVLRRNAQNLGLAGHVNLVLDLARGDIVTFAAGDDISLERRVETAVAALNVRPEASFFECGNLRIDDVGTPLGVAKLVFESDSPVRLSDFIKDAVKGLIGAARSYRKSAIMRFPPLDRSCPTEDSTFILRCLLLGSGWYGVEPLVKRRIHEANLSGEASLGSMDFGAIWRQYRSDADVALEQGMIEKATHAVVTRWIGGTAITRNLAQKSQAAPGAFYRECLLSLRGSGFGEVPRIEALVLVVKAIIRRLMKK
jgi:glycosyltransferase involved in cell wall biosynthesis